MSDITGQINAKKLEKTGMGDPDYLLGLFNGVGSFGVALVEFQVKQPHGPNTEGNRKVDLVLTIVEPALDDDTEAAVRELMRGMHADRKIRAGDQPALDGTTPSLEDTRSGALSHVERDADGNPVGVWDGDVEGERAKTDDGSCSFPGCQLDDGHDGDHDPKPDAQFTEQPGSDPAPKARKRAAKKGAS